MNVNTKVLRRFIIYIVLVTLSIVTLPPATDNAISADASSVSPFDTIERSASFVIVSAVIESQISEFENKEEKLMVLKDLGLEQTTLNKVIGSLPFIGEILVGKKTGEGVFGVSFKIKGPPKKLKTTVNPIKTLTPRFITRTLEKAKKK